MCLWSKPKPAPPPPQFDRLAMAITPTPLENATQQGPVVPAFGCPTPSVPCTADSQYFEDYCENGICCSNKHIGADFCACFESHFRGDRCDMHAEVLQPTTAASAPAVLIGSGFAVIVILVIVVVLIFWLCRRRQRQNQSEHGRTHNGERGNGETTRPENNSTPNNRLLHPDNENLVQLEMNEQHDKPA